ncbi:MAG: serine hydrolase [Bacteroidota bacterium]
MRSLVLVFSFLICQLSLHSQRSSVPNIPAADEVSSALTTEGREKMLSMIESWEPADFRGVVIIKDGKLEVEEYYNTFWRETVHDIRSAGKSITGILLGIAIDQGLVKDVEACVYDFFPEETFNYTITEAHKAIKIKHILTMSAGLDTYSDDPQSYGGEGNWYGKDDWLSYTLKTPVKLEPGKEWVYTDVCAQLAGGIVEETSGMSLEAFADKYLFGPLGFSEYYWFNDRTGRTAAAGNLYITTLDFAKLGLLVANKGKWGDQRIVSEQWIEQMTTSYLTIGEGPYPTGYGYFWYREDIILEDKATPYFYASGNGGNKIYVVPDLSLVVAITSSAYGRGYGHRRANDILLATLRALKK